MLRIPFSIIIVTLNFGFFSQSNENPNLRKPNFGFNFGLNQSLLYNSGDESAFKLKNGSGIRLGIISDFPIGKQLSIAPKAELSFNSSKLLQGSDVYKVNPVNLNFMTHLKYKMKNYEGKIKPYVYFGPNLNFPLTDESENANLAVRPSLGIDFAFGVDIELKHFFISPELRFTGGMTDIRQFASGNLLRGSNAALIINFSGK